MRLTSQPVGIVLLSSQLLPIGQTPLNERIIHAEQRFMTSGRVEFSAVDQFVGRRCSTVVRRFAIGRCDDDVRFTAERVKTTPSADRTISIASTTEQ